METTTYSRQPGVSILPLEREDLAEARRIFAACGETELAGAGLEQRFEQGALFNDDTHSFMLWSDSAPTGVVIVSGLETLVPLAKLYLPSGTPEKAAPASIATGWLADCAFSMRWYITALAFRLIPARSTADGRLSALATGGAYDGVLEITRADWEGWDSHPVRDRFDEVPAGGAPLAIGDLRYEPLTEEGIPFLQRVMLSRFEFYNYRPVNRQRLEQWFREGKFFGNKDRYFIVSVENQPAGIVRVENVLSHAPEVGLRLLGPWQSRGIGIHATDFIVDHAFTGLPRLARKVRALTAAANAGGNKTLRRFGFTLEGISRQQWYIRGRWRDAAIYSMLRSEWEQLS